MQNDWEEIKSRYAAAMAKILASPHDQWALDSYYIPWFANSSPIERRAWDAIRLYGAVMYPQFLVDCYFADFAHPKLKIILELDGKQFHDRVKDAERDAVLMAQGWTTYRVPGSECVKFIDLDRVIEKQQEYSKAHYRETELWAFNTIHGIVAALAHRYFRPLSDDEGMMSDEKKKFREYLRKAFDGTLSKHLVRSF